MSDHERFSNDGERGSGGPPRPKRRRELDALTTIVVLSLVIFHTVSIFSGQQLIRNTSQSELTTILASFVVASEFIWIMPVMMLVAGVAIWHSLNRRTPGEFLYERAMRLGIPFITGLVLLNPPQVYYYLKADAGLTEGFLAFYPKFWNVRITLSSFPFFESHQVLKRHSV